MLSISPVSLQSAIQTVFEGAGVQQSDAAIVAKHLVDAELCGVASHGVIRVAQYLAAIRVGKTDPRATLKLVCEDGGTATMDGGNGLGQVMASHAMAEAIAQARRYGIAAVTLTGIGHTGRLASYAEQATQSDMIGIVFANAGGRGQWMAPFGGSSGRLSTNPMAFAIPTEGDPLVVDIATSVVPEGKVRARKVEGKAVPDGWLVDSAGRPSNDPNALYTSPRGALQPFGGHKGFGLSLVIDALAGGLSGAGCCVSDEVPLESETDGILLIAMDVTRFRNPADYRREISLLLRHVKSSPTIVDVVEILTPGELEQRSHRHRQQSGIPVSSSTWDALYTEFAAAGVSVEIISQG